MERNPAKHHREGNTAVIELDADVVLEAGKKIGSGDCSMKSREKPFNGPESRVGQTGETAAVAASEVAGDDAGYFWLWRSQRKAS